MNFDVNHAPGAGLIACWPAVQCTNTIPRQLPSSSSWNNEMVFYNCLSSGGTLCRLPHKGWLSISNFIFIFNTGTSRDVAMHNEWTVTSFLHIYACTGNLCSFCSNSAHHVEAYHMMIHADHFISSSALQHCFQLEQVKMCKKLSVEQTISS